MAIRGVEPFYLKVYVHQDFTTTDEIEGYIHNRKATLSELASRDANRQIEVSISPTAPLALLQAWDLKDAYALDVDEIAIEIFLQGQRHSTMGVGEPEDPGERAIVDFTSSTEALEARLRELVPPQVATEEGCDISDFEFKLVWMRGKMRAADALSLASSPSIMLVDPISDLLDAYRGSVVEVRVIDVPHLLAIKDRVKSVPNEMLPPVAVQATPTPHREVR